MTNLENVCAWHCPCPGSSSSNPCYWTVVGGLEGPPPIHGIAWGEERPVGISWQFSCLPRGQGTCKNAISHLWKDWRWDRSTDISGKMRWLSSFKCGSFKHPYLVGLSGEVSCSFSLWGLWRWTGRASENKGAAWGRRHPWLCLHVSVLLPAVETRYSGGYGTQNDIQESQSSDGKPAPRQSHHCWQTGAVGSTTRKGQGQSAAIWTEKTKLEITRKEKADSPPANPSADSLPQTSNTLTVIYCWRCKGSHVPRSCPNYNQYSNSGADKLIYGRYCAFYD